ncbi:phenylalanine--tRNA ligase subunit beta [Novosphingobium sp.]|uniref:phenylalanine--tRNA ligase subunit beta n=1 Tax=Novosphingobium sp. TaxID=1874826 RepID=UPI0025CCADEF|nr:phenylalanine--tRNA ligase subunit beta [Novosphingobium sp.]
MKFSLSWLKDHLETEATAETIAEKLNAIGLEVESLDDPAARLSGFTVARVLTAERHPNADKLQVLSVDTGSGEALQVVCGAPNARAGLVGVLGLPGAVVPAGGFELKKSAIRGVESNGMMCSTRELELGDDHDGIIELPADAPIGMPFSRYHGSDPVFDVAITPNRPDCMGIDGIARDLAAAGLGSFRHKSTSYQPISGSFPCPVKITVEQNSGCHVFWGRVIRGVKNGPSPEWLQARLMSAGLRPISALVDITNYFSVDRARPLHVYDLAKLQGGITVRRGRAGESFLALNDKTYTVTSEDCVIADDSAVLGLGGIIGGEDTGVCDTTADILLECAWFDPDWIARSGQRHAVTTDARQRFERGVDPMMLSVSIETAAKMIIDLCGGDVSEPVIAGQFPADGYPAVQLMVPYSPSQALTLGGVDIAPETQRGILGRLGFLTPDPDSLEIWNDAAHKAQALATVGWDDALAKHPDSWLVRVPTWRPDIVGWPDIVEEVVRIHGIDRVTSTALPRTDGVARPTATPAQKLERKVRRGAAARGLSELVTWSFLPEAEGEHFAEGSGGLWMLANPISEDMKVMRPSLLPGLLAAAQRNLNRGAAGLRIFELGRRYLRGDAGHSDERLTLGIVLAGEKTARGWAAGKPQAFDAFDAKAEALALLAEAGAPVDNLQVMAEAGPQFHPGQSATLRLGPKTVLARFGMVHPATLKAFDIDVPVAAAELYLDAVPARKGAPGFARAAYAPPALQAVTRDFAFLVDAALPAGDLVRAVKGADKANVVAVRVFDDFRGQGVPDGQKSLAIEVTLQPAEKSFTEADLKAIAERITTAAAKLGGILRG